MASRSTNVAETALSLAVPVRSVVCGTVLGVSLTLLTTGWPEIYYHSLWLGFEMSHGAHKVLLAIAGLVGLIALCLAPWRNRAVLLLHWGVVAAAHLASAALCAAVGKDGENRPITNADFFTGVATAALPALILVSLVLAVSLVVERGVRRSSPSARREPQSADARP